MDNFKKKREAILEDLWLNENLGPSIVSRGCDAAIALDLPVIFNEWVKDWPFGFKRNDEYHIIMQTIFPHYTTEGYGEPTSKQLYQYWLNNIYNPE